MAQLVEDVRRVDARVEAQLLRDHLERVSGSLSLSFLYLSHPFLLSLHLSLSLILTIFLSCFVSLSLTSISIPSLSLLSRSLVILLHLFSRNLPKKRNSSKLVEKKEECEI